ncbi:hypothetical protein Q8A67_009952 [Cirrhinus molitorella]|uniref:Uncharacterized protein n=1 Tax=Cirrhinus molitorella TaxID=172907 RepID=A0AA88PRG3_9TELE|nr:hypothetical protein Q8A67_009952 [Cirrhinus molitorella]
MLGLLVMSAAVAMTAAQLQQLKKQNRPPILKGIGAGTPCGPNYIRISWWDEKEEGEDNDEPSAIVSITLSFRTGGGKEAGEKQSLLLSGPSKGHMTHLKPYNGKPCSLTVVISVKQEM